MEEQARAALDVLRTTPGVRSVRMVDLAEQERLLEPWLGPDVPIESLPVPLMVEVEIDRTILDQAGLRERLAAEAPGAVYDDHAGWRQPLVVTAGRLGRFALGCLVALGLGMAAVAGMSARATLAGSGAEVATLRLVGARDGFIGGAPTHRSTMAALAGATVGTAAACILLALVPQRERAGFLSRRDRPRRLGVAAAAPGAAGGGADRLGRGRVCDAARPQGVELTGMLLVRSLVFDLLLYATMAVMGILGAPLALWSVDGAYAVCRAYCRVVFFYLRGSAGSGSRCAGRCRRARCWSRPSTSRSSTS